MNELEQIKELVTQYIQRKRAEEKFVPGESLVHYSGPYFDEKEYNAAIDVLLSEWNVHADKCKQAEREFPALLDKKFGVLTNSGSSANLLMFAALSSEGNFGSKFKLPRGSKVLTPVTCFPTTISPALALGFEPVFCDVELPSLNPNLDEVEEILKANYHNGHGNRIRVFIYAHVMGNPVDLDRVHYLMDKYDCIFLEDTCDALGGYYDGKKLGSFGLMSSVSLYVAHHISAVEGGVVATDNPQLLRVLDSQRSWGRGCHCSCPITNNNFDASKGETACANRFGKWLVGDGKDITYDHRYVHDEMAFNIKPLEMQGAILLEQMKKLPEMEQARRANFNALEKIFGKYEKYLHLPKATDKSDPCWFGYLMTVREDAPFSRDEITGFLEQSKIQTRTYFTGNILYHKGYSHLAKGYGSVKERFNVADFVTRNSFFLGTYIGLTDEKINYIGEKVDEFFERLEDE